jgi:hypothetical protein
MPTDQDASNHNAMASLIHAARAVLATAKSFTHVDTPRHRTTVTVSVEDLARLEGALGQLEESIDLRTSWHGSAWVTRSGLLVFLSNTFYDGRQWLHPETGERCNVGFDGRAMLDRSGDLDRRDIVAPGVIPPDRVVPRGIF